MRIGWSKCAKNVKVPHDAEIFASKFDKKAS